jgi:hypothetical protein
MAQRPPWVLLYYRLGRPVADYKQAGPLFRYINRAGISRRYPLSLPTHSRPARFRSFQYMTSRIRKIGKAFLYADKRFLARSRDFCKHWIADRRRKMAIIFPRIARNSQSAGRSNRYTLMICCLPPNYLQISIIRLYRGASMV